MKLSKNVQTAWSNMLMDAVECEELKNNVYYNQLRDKYMELWDKVRAMLPQDGRQLMRELDELDGTIRCIEDEIIYEKGLKDSTSLLKLLNVIS